MRLKTLAFLLAAAPALAAAATWQPISTEQGKRIEIDRDSIKDEGGKVQAWGRIVLERGINDPKSSASYRIIEALNRYDCASRSYSTLKRVFLKAEGEPLREEENKVSNEMPVRSGTLDDKLLREVCRPHGLGERPPAAAQTVDKAGAAAGDLRKANEAMVQKQLQKEVKHAAVQTPAEAPAAPKAPAATPEAAPEAHAATERRTSKRRPAKAPREEAHAEPAHAHEHLHWAYEGEGGPDSWAKLKPEYAACAGGKRQSPIDIRDGIRVDQPPIEFGYRPSQFRIVDNGHTVQVAVGGNAITVQGQTYELVQFHFHRPAEERVNGKSFDMVAHLVHKSDDGKLAVVAVLLEKGQEHPLIQTLWNNLPLEQNQDVTPPGLSIDPQRLLPENRGYYAYMGSLTTPPCSEGVLWLVMKQPVQMSPEQIAIFGRLYRNNARPVQPVSGRLIKESR